MIKNGVGLIYSSSKQTFCQRHTVVLRHDETQLPSRDVTVVAGRNGLASHRHTARPPLIREILVVSHCLIMKLVYT
ncbi:hypothetical protein HanHA89_Chr01g0009191 [Helianthus annuus]|nr:hypothetical protein HanHA89_Chr01g0009191 [Helianthus annuus]